MAIKLGEYNYQRFSWQSSIESGSNDRISIGLRDLGFRKLEPVPKANGLVSKSRIKTLIKILSNQKLNLI